MTARPAPSLHWLLVIAAAAAVSLPHLDKPFHIDDVLYLRVADQILRTPFDPYRDAVLWDAKNGQPASLFQTDHNPPLWKYAQAGALAMFAAPNRRGESEHVLHLLQSAAVVAAALGLFQLGRRATAYPLWATLFVLTAPFFLPGQNIMLEAPVLALSLWAMEFQVRSWTSDRPTAWGLGAGLLAAAAILTKYTAGLLLPILALESLRRRRFASLWFLAPAALALIGWACWGVATHGRPHLGAHEVVFDIGNWHYKSLNVLRLVGSMQTLGVAVALAVLFFNGRSVWKSVWFVGAASIIGGAVAWLDVVQARSHSALENADVTPLQRLHFISFTFHGVLSLSLVGWLLFGFESNGWHAQGSPCDSPGVVSADSTTPGGSHATHRHSTPESATLGRATLPSRMDDRFLLFWMSLVLVFNVCCTPFNAVRHLLLFFVPFTWAAMRVLERFDAAPVRWWALAASAAIGFGLASADHQFAESARKVAQTEVRGLVADRAAIGRHVWFSANWGFVHYAQRVGAWPWVANPEQYGLPPIQEGDYLIQPMIMSWTNLESALPAGLKLRWVKHWQPMAEVGPWPSAWLGQLLRTIAPGVNYYSIRANALPWEFLVTPVDSEERRRGALFAVPTVGDFRIYLLVRE